MNSLANPAAPPIVTQLDVPLIMRDTVRTMRIECNPSSA